MTSSSGATTALDCYCCHTYGRLYPSGNSIEERVKTIISALARKGLVLRRCSDYLVGDIVSVVQHGISSSRTVIIFLTRSLVQAVESSQFSVGQLEFNTAIRQRNSDTVFVALEPHTIQNFEGIVGLTLKSRMIIDFSVENLFEENSELLFSIVSQLLQGNPVDNATFSAVNSHRCASQPTSSSVAYSRFRPQSAQQSRVPMSSRPNSAREVVDIGSRLDSADIPKVAPSATKLFSANFQNAKPSTTLGDGSSASIPLVALTVDQVQVLLDKLNLSAFRETFCRQQITGVDLSDVVDERALVAMGISLLTKARLLFSRIQSYKLYGVSTELLGGKHVAGVALETVGSDAAPKRSSVPRPTSANSQDKMVRKSLYLCIEYCTILNVMFFAEFSGGEA
jgi:hypothetical protein